MDLLYNRLESREPASA